MAEEKIVEYIKKCHEKGIDDEKIYSSLMAAGWKEDQINDAFAFYRQGDSFGEEEVSDTPEKHPEEETDIYNLPDLFKCEVTDNQVPHRGTLWYILFSLTFMIISVVVVFLADWVVLFFVVAFTGVTLWRGHQGKIIDMAVKENGLLISGKQFLFKEMAAYYLSESGDSETIVFIPNKKYRPRLSFIFLEDESAEKVRSLLNGNVPEMEPRNEGYTDFLIRKLKL